MRYPDKKLRSILTKARNILDENYTGNYTRPAPDLYPHQWNWDSAFIAIGLSHIDPERACSEITSLFRGQWQNGMIPHIIFNPNFAHYEPGVEFWKTRNLPEKPSSEDTSGTTQPPLLPFAAEYVGKTLSGEKRRKFYLSVYPGLKRFINFFFKERMPNTTHLASIIHPWESGLDNSPRWDKPLSRVDICPVDQFKRVDNSIVDMTERPEEKDYLRYYRLVKILGESQYSPEKIYKISPFFVQPILFNIILLKSLHSLINIGRELGKNIEKLESEIQLIGSEITERLYTNGKFGDFDLKTGRFYFTETIARFLPLFAHDLLDFDVEKLLSELNQHAGYSRKGIFLYPSVAVNDNNYSPVRYWRGPVWININWFIFHGLIKAGKKEKARAVLQDSLYLVEKSGFREYYHPESGKGLGARQFSWTASLITDMIHNEP